MLQENLSFLRIKFLGVQKWHKCNHTEIYNTIERTGCHIIETTCIQLKIYINPFSRDFRTFDFSNIQYFPKLLSYKQYYLFGYTAVHPAENQPTFLSNMNSTDIL
jgi:hypothetical protein